MALDLRPTSAADFDDVSRVLAASYGALLSADYSSDVLAIIVPLISCAKMELISSGTYFAVEHDGQPIAVGGWTKIQPGTNQMIQSLGHIRHFATDPLHLRKGAAGMIMQRCLSEAKNSGIEKMECLSTRTAVPFYARYGFETIGEKTVLVAGVPFPSVEMVLKF
jgi:GNAT superfamily N-acetyltransferase